MPFPQAFSQDVRASRRRLARARLLRRCLAAFALVAVAALVLVGALRVGAPVAQVAAVDAPDSDGDHVPDVVENVVLGTDPRLAYATPLPEDWIHQHGLDPSDPDLASRLAAYPVPPESPAVYGPGGLPPEHRMTLGEVYAYGRPAGWNESRDGAWRSGLDPRESDVNDSGVPYAWLVRHGLDPFDAEALDAPQAGVPWTPREAYAKGLSPVSRDGDADGLDDERELALGTSPRLRSTSGSGIPDGWAVDHGFDPLDPTVAFDDTDRDGLDNLAEHAASPRLDPRKPSTVGGPIPDGWLVRYRLDPFDASIASRPTQSEDGLVLTTLDEYLVNRPPSWDERAKGPWWGGTDPGRDDTDVDGLSDVAEILGWNITTTRGAQRVTSDPTRADTDLDGISDGGERRGAEGNVTFKPTDPRAADSDFDGLEDGVEVGLRASPFGPLPRLDPVDPDSDDDGLLDGEEAAYWSERRAAALAGAAYPWGPEPRPPAREVLSADALLSTGDADGDGAANALDADADGDGLLDGWEARPEKYAESPFASSHARSPTDPARADTDLDALPDAWEIENAAFDDALGGWNLDPALWSSFGDLVPDGDRDLDGDSITWVSAERAAGGFRVVRHEFRASNKAEYAAGSDPNAFSSSPDGLGDGWKIFWGTEYFSLAPEERGDVYPGMPGDVAAPPERPPPRIGHDDARVHATLDYKRYAAADARVLPWEKATRVDVALGPSVRVEGRFEYDLKAVEGNRTNPYLDDTDGDGAPDAWEALWARLAEQAGDVSPIAADGGNDPDGDALPNAAESQRGTSPLHADSDRGGARDDVEAALGLDALDPSDDAQATQRGRDLDGDGIPDLEEARRVPPTRIDDPDTDHDGLLDGKRLSEVLGRPLRSGVAADEAILAPLAERGLIVVRAADGTADVLGEHAYGSDPTRPDSNGDDVPDGWAAVRGVTPTGARMDPATYGHGKPSWWREAEHGLWQWGLQLGERPTRDEDADGLDDLNGEDPIPVANRMNRLPRGDPREEGLAPLERLLRAQAYNGTDDRNATKQWHEVNVTLDPLPTARVPADGTVRFSGNVTVANATRLLNGTMPVNDTGVANVTVLLYVNATDVVLGAAVSNATGAFEGRILLAPAVPAPPGSEGYVVFGASDATGVRANPAAPLHAINVTAPLVLRAISYNVTHLAGAPSDLGWLANNSTTRLVNVTLGTGLSLSAPPVLSVRQPVAVNATLVDQRGAPVPNATLRLDPVGAEVATGPDGVARFLVHAPPTPGAWALGASFDGGGAFLASAADVALRVRTPTRLDLEVPRIDAHPDSSLLARGHLRDVEGRPLAGARVTTSDGDVLTTDRDGAFLALVRVPPGASPGDLPLEARYEGDDEHEPASAAAVVRIVGTPRWETTPLVARWGESPTLSARLVDGAGLPMGGRVVRVALPWGTVSQATSADGRVAVEMPLWRLPPGTENVRFSFSDPLEGAAEAAVPVTQVAPTGLRLDAVDLVRGNATVAGRLLVADLYPIARQPVVVQVGNVTTTALTGPDGRFLARVPLGLDARLGPATVAATFAGSLDGIHLPSTVSVEDRIVDALALSVADARVVRTEGLLRVRVDTLLGQPVRDAPLVLRTPWGEARGATDEGGNATLVLPVLPHDARGERAATLLAGPTASARQATLALVLHVVDRATVAVDAPAHLVAGQLTGLKVRGLDAAGAPLSGALAFEATLDGAPVAEGAGPQLSFRVPADARGNATLRVTIAAPSVHGEPWTATLPVRQPTRIAAVSVPTERAGESAVLRVALASGQEPVRGQPVLLYGAGVAPISALTDEDGVARLAVPALAGSATPLDVVFQGGGGYAASAVRVRVEPAGVLDPASNLLLYGVLAAIALLAVVGVLVARRLRAGRGSAVAAELRRAARALRSERGDVKAVYQVYVRLVAALGLPDDAEETLTFRQLMERAAVGVDADDARFLGDLFDQAIYAPHPIEPAAVEEASRRLERMSRAIAARGAGA